MGEGKMSSDIPLPMKFQHVMSHTLPGFFSAITLFMLIDVWSPRDLTSLAIKDISSLVSFIGFVLIFGTILGIILDGIHHTIIEDRIFDDLEGYKKTKDIRNEWMRNCGGLLDTTKCFQKTQTEGQAIGQTSSTCSDCDNKDDKEKCPILKKGFTRHYSFKTTESKVIELNNFLIEDYYSYSEFYSNTFLSLIPFSWILPSFLLKTFEVPYNLSFSLGSITFIFAWICLYSSYNSYIAYANVVNSVMFGYIKKKENQDIKGNLSLDVKVGLTANVKGEIK
jgi:hypothetical protein